MLDEYFIDSETVGFVGPMVLLQYAKNDDPVVLHEVWRRPGRETLQIIERIALNKETGFNLVFDHFHEQKIHSMLSCLSSRQLNAPPRIEDMALIEREAPMRGVCIRVASALDVYLQLMIGPLQKLMERKPIRIRKIPAIVAPELMAKLTHALQFEDIYFKRKKDGMRWKAEPCRDGDSQFVDLVLSFGASRKLKHVHQYLFDEEPIMFPMPEDMHPEELPWSPYHDNRPNSWPFKIQAHIDYWATNELGRQYGVNDVEYVRDIQRKYKFPHGDMESTLACMIGSVRYRGMPIDIDGVQKELKRSRRVAKSAGKLHWQVVLPKLHELCSDDLERMAITSSADESLETIEKWADESGKEGTHPAAKYATTVRAARAARFRADWLGKLAQAGRFHPSLNPMGTLTRRASGSGGLNPLNIDKEKVTRKLFLLADNPKTWARYYKYVTDLGFEMGKPPSWSLSFVGCGGDFDSFETVLAIAAWQDKLLKKYVDKGVKPYHVFGSFIYRNEIGGPDNDPAVALVNIQKPENKIQYADRSKNCWYALIYGAQEFKISQTAGVAIEVIVEALRCMGEQCVGMAAGRQKVFDDLACIIQDYENGPFVWREPNPKIPNLLGWERDFSFDIGIIRAMFEFPKHLPRDWSQGQRIVRKNREQTILGACHSAIFGCVKQMEARIKRQAGNCIMQSTGAMYCKDLQVRVWDKQPAGAHPWQVVTLNIYDEIEAARQRAMTLKGLVDGAIKEYKKAIPLMQMEWKDKIGSWADK